MAGREAFDRLTCILVNEAFIFETAGQEEIPALYMSPGECLKCYMDLQLMEMLLFTKEMDCMYGETCILKYYSCAMGRRCGIAFCTCKLYPQKSGNIPGVPLLVLFLIPFSSPHGDA